MLLTHKKISWKMVYAWIMGPSSCHSEKHRKYVVKIKAQVLLSCSSPPRPHLSYESWPSSLCVFFFFPQQVWEERTDAHEMNIKKEGGTIAEFMWSLVSVCVLSAARWWVLLLLEKIRANSHANRQAQFPLFLGLHFRRRRATERVFLLSLERKWTKRDHRTSWCKISQTFRWVFWGDYVGLLEPEQCCIWCAPSRRYKRRILVTLSSADYTL